MTSPHNPYVLSEMSLPNSYSDWLKKCKKETVGINGEVNDISPYPFFSYETIF